MRPVGLSIPKPNGTPAAAHFVTFPPHSGVTCAGCAARVSEWAGCAGEMGTEVRTVFATDDWARL